MKIRPTSLAMIACAAVLALPAAAQDMKPGLWEMSSKVSSPDSEVQAAMSAVQSHLASMSPEQRKGMQQMLERNGVQMDLGDGGAVRTRACMTRKMIQRREFPLQEGNCTQKVTPVSGKRMNVVFSCSKPATAGEGELIVDSDTSYRANMHIRGTEGGNRQEVDVNGTGRWLGADCGGLRPVGVAQAK
jgi:hypothetical protein